MRGFKKREKKKTKGNKGKIRVSMKGKDQVGGGKIIQVRAKSRQIESVTELERPSVSIDKLIEKMKAQRDATDASFEKIDRKRRKMLFTTSV